MSTFHSQSVCSCDTLYYLGVMIPRLQRITLSQQLRDRLVAKIVDGSLASGGPLPTEAQIGATYGVSRVTVRRVIDDLVKSGLVQRERGRAAFVRSREVVTPDQPRLVGCVLSDLQLPTVVDVLTGIEGVLRPAGFEVLLMNSGGDPEKERENIDRLSSLPLAGVIFRPCVDYASSTQLATVHATRLPMVMVDRYDPAIDCDRVEMENEESSRELVTLLLHLGHRRVGCVQWSARQCSVIQSRRLGYDGALSAGAIPIDESLIVSTEQSEAAVAEAVDRLLALVDPPTAIFGMNDRIATFVVRRVQILGLNVPDDIAVVGFGDSETGEMLSVPLTTVRWSKVGLGETAAQLLLTRLARADQPPRHEVLPCSLVVRASSGGQRVVARDRVALPI